MNSISRGTESHVQKNDSRPISEQLKSASKFSTKQLLDWTTKNLDALNKFFKSDEGLNEGFKLIKKLVDFSKSSPGLNEKIKLVIEKITIDGNKLIKNFQTDMIQKKTPADQMRWAEKNVEKLNDMLKVAFSCGNADTIQTAKKTAVDFVYILLDSKDKGEKGADHVLSKLTMASNSSVFDWALSSAAVGTVSKGDSNSRTLQVSDGANQELLEKVSLRLNKFCTHFFSGPEYSGHRASAKFISDHVSKSDLEIAKEVLNSNRPIAEKQSTVL